MFTISLSHNRQTYSNLMMEGPRDAVSLSTRILVMHLVLSVNYKTLSYTEDQSSYVKTANKEEEVVAAAVEEVDTEAADEEEEEKKILEMVANSL